MTARAAVLPAIAASLEIVELTVPEPSPGTLVVDIEYAGICGTDVHLQQGRLPIPLPLGLGHEAVGRVRALGDGMVADALGRQLSVGDPVAWASSIPCRDCYYCVSEKEFSLCERRVVYGINQTADEWPHASGSWAESIYLRPGSTVLRLGDGVSGLEAISLGCAGPTVAHALLRSVPPRVGECVVVQGCGPVGMAAAMFAKLAGAGTVVMVGALASRLDLAKSMGVADVTIDMDEHSESGDRLELVLGETVCSRGADLVVEAAGVPTAVAEGIDMCRRNGRYLVLGQYTDHGATLINPHLITRKQIQVTGSWAFAGEDFIAYVKSLPALASRFDLARMVTKYALADVNDALTDMQSGRALKPVLVPHARTKLGESS